MKANTNNLYNQSKRPYPDFRGMDKRKKPGFAYLENMYIDYEGAGDAVESIVGYRKIRKFKDGIHSVCIIGDGDEAQLIIHSGNALYRLPVSERDESLPIKAFATLNDNRSTAISLGSLCLISDGSMLISVSLDGKTALISEDKSIVGCSCAVIYGGRLFLSGNPECPGRVFYSSLINDGEIGIIGSFTDESCNNILSLISIDGYLGIFYKNEISFRKTSHSESSDGYPTVRVIDGIEILSRVMVFGRELVFMSPDGLTAMQIPTGEGEIKLNCCSSAVNHLLLNERLDGARLGVWMGYLVICLGKRFYLADPRGDKGYDWYLISGVGGYENDRRVYRYRKIAENGYDTHSNPDETAEGEIYSRGTESGELIYYSVEGDKRYSVYPTAELTGGKILPPRFLMCKDGLMWFATEDGGIYLFNNDKRGIAPNNIPYAESCLTTNESISATAIHPIYYSFAGHAPRYVAITNSIESSRDGKKTCGGAYNIGLKPLSREKIILTDIADEKPIGDQIISTENYFRAAKAEDESKNYGFLALHLPDRIPSAERKQLCIRAESFASPFGIGYIDYQSGSLESSKNKGKEK